LKITIPLWPHFHRLHIARPGRCLCVLDKRPAVATLNGITAYHQFSFPSPLGLEVAAASTSSFDFDEQNNLRLAPFDQIWTVADEDVDLITRAMYGTYG